MLILILLFLAFFSLLFSFFPALAAILLPSFFPLLVIIVRQAVVIVEVVFPCKEILVHCNASATRTRTRPSLALFTLFPFAFALLPFLSLVFVAAARRLVVHEQRGVVLEQSAPRQPRGQARSALAAARLLGLLEVLGLLGLRLGGLPGRPGFPPLGEGLGIDRREAR